MNERIHRLREMIVHGEHRHLRDMSYEYDTSVYRTDEHFAIRIARRTEEMLKAQTPVFIAEHGFIPIQTTPFAPDSITTEEMDEIKKKHYVPDFRRGRTQNFTPDYGRMIADGLEKTVLNIRAAAEKFSPDSEERIYLRAQEDSCLALLEFAKRYKAAAREAGRDDIADVLETVPAKGATTLREAMQTMRLVMFMLWCEGSYNITLGRMDQYLYPYYDADMKAGRLTRESALELMCDFFLSFNIDSDMYYGSYHGSNGQTVVLGGYDADGTDRYNELSELMMLASLELKVIDPKINLRVNSKTPIERYEFASRLTAVGIGFPQYSNDDVVIPGLLRLGYEPDDAYNYTIAACWEFIVPGTGYDIPNIDWVSFLTLINEATYKDLPECRDYEEFVCACERRITADAAWRASRWKNIFLVPSPFATVCMNGITERGSDISLGAKYNNMGMHGIGIANAVDSVYAVKKLVFEEKMPAEELIAILNANWEGHEALRVRVLTEFAKFGSDEEETNRLAARFLNAYSKAFEGKTNERGGVYRAGTGTAMLYINYGVSNPASADGRKKGEFLPANYSPSIQVRGLGPFSIIRSFTSPDLTGTINGGPLTLEFSPSALKGEENLKKLGALVKTFIELGGHQLQLNVINKSDLIDAQKHPENYRNLIVRVWGWSGYFVELGKDIQNQIISRADLTV